MSTQTDDNDKTDQSERLTSEIWTFVGNTIIGHERGMYRFLSTRGQPTQILKHPNAFALLFGGAVANYFNGAYRSLILRDDAYIMECFDKMHAICNHSYICLLNIVCTMYVEAHGSIDRSALDTSSLAQYEASVRAQLYSEILGKLRAACAAAINHECDGIDIATCDPNEPMFEARSLATSK